MPKMRLTIRAIRDLPAPHPSGRQTLFWDAEQRGFGLLVSGVSASKSYVVQREVNGRSRRVTLGTVAEFEASGRTLDDARAEAAELVLGMRRGIDPKARRQTNPTLRHVLDRYLADHPRLAERSQRGYRRSVERWLSDWLDVPLRDVNRESVEQRFRKIQATVAKRSNGDGANRSSEPGAASANGAMRTLRVLWNYAAHSVPDLPTNPVKLSRRWFAVPERERIVTGDQLPAFYAAVSALPSRTMRDYLLVLLFTGLRRSEAAGLRWADIDFAERIIRLPARRTKAKRKLDLPMSDFVFELLRERRAIGIENAYVFPGDSASGHLEEPKKALAQVGEACGVTVAPHDLRRSFITVASRCRIAPLELKALVNHALGGDVTAAYAQLSAADLADAMQTVCDRLLALACGGTSQGP